MDHVATQLQRFNVYRDAASLDFTDHVLLSLELVRLVLLLSSTVLENTGFGLLIPYHFATSIGADVR